MARVSTSNARPSAAVGAPSADSIYNMWDAATTPRYAVSAVDEFRCHKPGPVPAPQGASSSSPEHPGASVRQAAPVQSSGAAGGDSSPVTRLGSLAARQHLAPPPQPPPPMPRSNGTPRASATSPRAGSGRLTGSMRLADPLAFPLPADFLLATQTAAGDCSHVSPVAVPAAPEGTALAVEAMQGMSPSPPSAPMKVESDTAAGVQGATGGWPGGSMSQQSDPAPGSDQRQTESERSRSGIARPRRRAATRKLPDDVSELSDADPDSDPEPAPADDMESSSDNEDSVETHARVKPQGERRRTSGFVGVGACNGRKGLWQARTLVEGKVTHLGHYECEEDAARVYDRVVLAVHGPGAHTNFPSSQYCRQDIRRLSNLGRAALQSALGIKPMTKSSRFRGVSKKKAKWEARVMVGRRWAFRALFDCEESAARAYDAAVWRLKPSSAKAFVNFPEERPSSRAAAKAQQQQQQQARGAGQECMKEGEADGAARGEFGGPPENPFETRIADQNSVLPLGAALPEQVQGSRGGGALNAGLGFGNTLLNTSAASAALGGPDGGGFGASSGWQPMPFSEPSQPGLPATTMQVGVPGGSSSLGVWSEGPATSVMGSTAGLPMGESGRVYSPFQRALPMLAAQRQAASRAVEMGHLAQTAERVGMSAGGQGPGQQGTATDKELQWIFVQPPNGQQRSTAACNLPFSPASSVSGGIGCGSVQMQRDPGEMHGQTPDAGVASRQLHLYHARKALSHLESHSLPGDACLAPLRAARARSALQAHSLPGAACFEPQPSSSARLHLHADSLPDSTRIELLSSHDISCYRRSISLPEGATQLGRLGPTVPGECMTQVKTENVGCGPMAAMPVPAAAGGDSNQVSVTLRPAPQVVLRLASINVASSQPPSPAPPAVALGCSTGSAAAPVDGAGLGPHCVLASSPSFIAAWGGTTGAQPVAKAVGGGGEWGVHTGMDQAVASAADRAAVPDGDWPQISTQDKPPLRCKSTGNLLKQHGARVHGFPVTQSAGLRSMSAVVPRGPAPGGDNPPGRDHPYLPLVLSRVGSHEAAWNMAELQEWQLAGTPVPQWPAFTPMDTSSSPSNSPRTVPTFGSMQRGQDVPLTDGCNSPMCGTLQIGGDELW